MEVSIIALASCRSCAALYIREEPLSFDMRRRACMWWDATPA